MSLGPGLSLLYRHFTDAGAPVVIPSPFDPLIEFYHAVRAHTAYVRAEQEAFQQRLEAIGIERLSRMTAREVLQNYGCR